MTDETTQTTAQADTAAPAEAPSEAELMEALKSVYDPEIGLSIVDLGLVYGVRTELPLVIIDMTLTTPMCPLGPVIKSQAYSVLTSRFPQVEDVDMNLVWTPRWDPRTMASEEAKAELGFW
jgi:metal-sulfur cluster biosynthetic enzyme